MSQALRVVDDEDYNQVAPKGEKDKEKKKDEKKSEKGENRGRI